MVDSIDTSDTPGVPFYFRLDYVPASYTGPIWRVELADAETPHFCHWATAPTEDAVRAAVAEDMPECTLRSIVLEECEPITGTGPGLAKVSRSELGPEELALIDGRCIGCGSEHVTHPDPQKHQGLTQWWCDRCDPDGGCHAAG